MVEVGSGLRLRETPAGSSQPGERGEAVHSSLILSRRGLALQGVEEEGPKTTQRNLREARRVCKLLLAPPTKMLPELFYVGLVWNPLFLSCYKVGSRRLCAWSRHLSQSAWLGEGCAISRAVTILSSPEEVVFSVTF